MFMGISKCHGRLWGLIIMYQCLWVFMGIYECYEVTPVTQRNSTVGKGCDKVLQNNLLNSNTF